MMTTASTTRDTNPFPEHEKLRARQYDASLLSGFIDFLAEQGWELAQMDKHGDLWPIHKRPEEIIGMFLGIDPKKLEQEKQQMLNEIRKANDAADRKRA